MNNAREVYSLQSQISTKQLKFLFIRAGIKKLVKVVQYSYISDLLGKDVYNLGFGDYDVGSDTIFDDVNTNNGDATLVALRLKDRELFPKKNEQAKRALQRIKIAKAR